MNNVRNFSHQDITNLIEQLKENNSILRQVEISPDNAIKSIRAELLNSGFEPQLTFSGMTLEESKELILTKTEDHIFEELKKFIEKIKSRASASVSTNADETEMESSEHSELNQKPEIPDAENAPLEPNETSQPEIGSAVSPVERMPLGHSSPASTEYSKTLPNSQPAMQHFRPVDNRPTFSISIPAEEIANLKTMNRDDARFRLKQIIGTQLENCHLNPNILCKNVNFNRSSGGSQICGVGANKTLLDVLSDVYVAKTYGLLPSQLISEEKQNPGAQQAAPQSVQGMQGAPSSQDMQTTPTQGVQTPTQGMQVATQSVQGMQGAPSSQGVQTATQGMQTTTQASPVTQGPTAQPTSDVFTHEIAHSHNLTEAPTSKDDVDVTRLSLDEQEQLLKQHYENNNPNVTILTLEEADKIIETLMNNGRPEIPLEVGAISEFQAGMAKKKF